MLKFLPIKLLSTIALLSCVVHGYDVGGFDGEIDVSFEEFETNDGDNTSLERDCFRNTPNEFSPMKLSLM